MGHQLAYLAAVVGLACGSACSLIYNPSNLATVNADADVDAKYVADADPSMLSLSHVTPALLVEGEGSGGGRSGVLVVHGIHLVPGAQVAVALHGGGTAKVTVDNTAAQVSDDGYMVAVPIIVDVDPDLDAGMTLRLDVTVTQPNGGSTIAKTLDMLEEPAGAPALQIEGLDELTGGAVALPSGVNEFSSVELTGGVTAMTPANGPVIVRASSSISITGISQVNAVGKTGGAGGAAGGALGTVTVPPTPGMGAGGGQISGGGASYGSKGGGNSPAPVGDAALRTLDAPNRGSGGAGGAFTLTVPGGNGGAGGGGGGTIEISAAGTLSLGTIEAKGAAGTVGAGDDGGGGSGGTILLRSGVSVLATAVTAAGGGSSIGPGGDGRIRIDAPTMVPPATTPELYRGPSFLATTALITRNAKPSIRVRGEPLRPSSYFFVNDAQNNMRGPFPPFTFSPSGDAEIMIDEPLFEGINLLCMQVEGADIADQKPEARNCIKIVYLYVKPAGA
ncbi:MAG: hypothetical protein WKG01_37640 [Kofleriaceae bacterium]